MYSKLKRETGSLFPFVVPLVFALEVYSTYNFVNTIQNESDSLFPSSCVQGEKDLLRSSVLQRVAACCSVLQCVAVGVVVCVAVCIAVCVAVCCSCSLCPRRGALAALQCVAACCSVLQHVAVCCSVLQCVAVFVAVLLATLQCVAACCSVCRSLCCSMCCRVCCSVL